MSKVRLTDREVNGFNDSCDVLALLLNEKSIRIVIQDAYGGEFSTKIIKKSLDNIYKVQKKINNGIKETKEGVVKKEAFFTKEVSSTKNSRKLAEITEDIPNLKLRYAQEESSCHTDVRSMILAYINHRELRDETGGKNNQAIEEVGTQYLPGHGICSQKRQENYTYSLQRDSRTVSRILTC